MPPCRILVADMKCTVTPTGDYDNRCLSGRDSLFPSIASLCPSFALAKASCPTDNKISGKTALRDTDCTGGADEFFFG